MFFGNVLCTNLHLQRNICYIHHSFFKRANSLLFLSKSTLVLVKKKQAFMYQMRISIGLTVRQRRDCSKKLKGNAQLFVVIVMMDRWRGRVALVTGASVGIGAAIAKSFTQHGMKVVGCARNVEQIEVCQRCVVII